MFYYHRCLPKLDTPALKPSHRSVAVNMKCMRDEPPPLAKHQHDQQDNQDKQEEYTEKEEEEEKLRGLLPIRKLVDDASSTTKPSPINCRALIVTIIFLLT